MKLAEARLKEIIREEVELFLLTEEMKREILNEGIVAYLDKVFGRREKWQDLVDDIEEDGELDKKSFLDLPSRERVAALALAGLLAAGGAQLGAQYMELASVGEVSAAQQLSDAMMASQERAQDIQNFRDMAQASAEPGVADTDVNQYLDDIRNNYTFEDAPISPGRGLFIDGDPTKPAQGFVYVPADQISDDTVLPLVGMTKADYEAFLRIAWLAGDSGGDERLADYVTGGGRAGSSVFWSYEDSLYSPIIDNDSDESTREKMEAYYGDTGEDYLILPLEWSIARDIMDARANR